MYYSRAKMLIIEIENKHNFKILLERMKNVWNPNILIRTRYKNVIPTAVSHNCTTVCTVM